MDAPHWDVDIRTGVPPALVRAELESLRKIGIVPEHVLLSRGTWQLWNASVEPVERIIGGGRVEDTGPTVAGIRAVTTDNVPVGIVRFYL